RLRPPPAGEDVPRPPHRVVVHPVEDRPGARAVPQRRARRWPHSRRRLRAHEARPQRPPASLERRSADRQGAPRVVAQDRRRHRRCPGVAGPSGRGVEGCEAPLLEGADRRPLDPPEEECMTVSLSTAQGLSQDEIDVIEALKSRLTANKRRNDLRKAYYEAEEVVQQLGIAIPPSLRDVQTVVGWPATVVDALAERLTIDGF